MGEDGDVLLERLLETVRAANDDASALAKTHAIDTDARDHLMQAHFRLTEAVAHIRIAKRDAERGRTKRS